MPEFFSSFPSQQVKPASVNISDLVNTMRGAQAYQSGEIALEQQTVGNEEQRKIAEALKQDPGLFMTDNRLDIDKVNRIIPQLAPRTGSKYLQEYGTLHKAQTEAIKAKLGLSQDIRSTIGTPFRILGEAGVPDPNVYIAAGESLKKQFPDLPDVHRYVDAALTPFKMVKQPGPAVAQMAIQGAQSLLTPAQAEDVFGPKTGTVNFGTDIMQTTTKAMPGGQPAQLTVGPQIGRAQVAPGSYYTDTGKTDLNNNPIYSVKNKDGVVVGEITVPRGVDPSQMPGMNVAPQPLTPQAPQANTVPAAQQPGGATTFPVAPPANVTPQPTVPSNAPVRFPTGETPETLKVYQQQTLDATGQAQPANVALNNIRTVRQYLPFAQTGASSQTIAQLQSVFGNVAASKPEEFAAAARDIIEKNIADLALQKNAALGGKFAADLAAVQNSLSSAGKNPTAIVKVMDQLEPLMQHVYNYQAGLNRVVQNNPQSYFAKRQYDIAMNDAFDIRALMMKNAFDNGGKEGLDKFLKDNKINVRDQQGLFRKLEAYGRLVRGEL